MIGNCSIFFNNYVLFFSGLCGFYDGNRALGNELIKRDGTSETQTDPFAETWRYNE